jgi:hypothetical protein
MHLKLIWPLKIIHTRLECTKFHWVGDPLNSIKWNYLSFKNVVSDLIVVVDGIQYLYYGTECLCTSITIYKVQTEGASI